MASVTVRGTGGIDTRDFKAVAKALRKAQPALARELVKELRVAGQLVANDAKAIVSDYSSSIPPTIKVRVRGVGVAVEAGGPARSGIARELHESTYGGTYGIGGTRQKAMRLEKEAETAIAGLFELGNAGGGKSAAASSKGIFRHPVFGGSGDWVDQPMHPYLAPAGEKNKAAIEERVLAALDKVTRIVVVED